MQKILLTQLDMTIYDHRDFLKFTSNLNFKMTPPLLYWSLVKAMYSSVDVEHEPQVLTLFNGTPCIL